LATSIIWAATTIASSTELPNVAAVLDPDIVWDIEPDVIGEISDPSAFAVSPDDKWIAYISKGALWKCKVATGPPTKLVDLPNTKTAFLATPEYRTAWGDIVRAGKIDDHHIFLGKLPDSTLDLFGLAWTPSQDGVVFTLGENSQERPWTVVYRVMHASTEGVVSSIATITRDVHDNPHRFKIFHVTRDKKFVIASTGYRPLIWDAHTNRPVATFFDVLVPSSTSGRFLGVEIDTRQLVVADASFKITKRFDVIFNWRQFCDLFWSPDERFAIGRSHLEHPSKRWIGFWTDLQSGHRVDLEGSNVAERWIFTGRAAEAIRTSGSNLLTILPGVFQQERDILRVQGSSFQSEFWYKAGRYPPVRIGRLGELFAAALPRNAGKPGYQYFLMDRNGNRWAFGQDKESLRVSPFHIVAICNDEQTIIACDETRLFSLPVTAILKNINATDE
jgi:hypothetical protein